MLDDLTVEIKSADSENAKKITDILYKMVDEQEIESFKVKEIVKGENSIDLSPFIPILEEFDFEAAYEMIKEHGLFAISQGYIGLKIIREILSIVKAGIEISDKLKGKESQFSVSYKINRHTVLKYGRSFGIEPFDTILTSAAPDTMKDMFLGENKWGEIPIAVKKHYLIQYIAIFVKQPTAAITHIGTVSHIEYNSESKKSTVFLKGKPKKLGKPIPYNKKWLHYNAHGTLYTTKERIDNAKTLADVYPSLDNRKK